MTTISANSTSWSEPVTLAKDEVWQCRGGTVCLTTTESPGSQDGLKLDDSDGIRFSAGLSVRYRKEGRTSPIIIREAV